MTVSVLVPWTPGCPWRERAWVWLQERYADEHPGWEVVTGSSDPGSPSRSQGILDAASRASGDVLVISDADVWCDPAEAVERAATSGWAIPHRLVHRLAPDSTSQVLGGADWRGLPLSADNLQDRRPYRGNDAGTLLVVTREALEIAPPDPRFTAWGQEDDAWAHALHTLVGAPWRGKDDLVHLWHPPQERKNRRIGTDEQARLARRYAAARGSRRRMAALLDEFRSAPVDAP